MSKMNSATNTFNKTNHFVKSKTNSQLILNSQTNSTTETQIYFASLKMLMDKNDFNNFIDSLHIYLPNISQRYPDVLLAAYQCWLLLYKATDMTNDYEMIFSKYIIPLCLQCPEQMHQLKTKQLYSYLGNSNMIIKDNTRFKELVEQYINRVLLLVNSLIHKEVNTQQGIDAQTQIEIDSIVLTQIESQMVQLFQINNPIKYFLNKKTYSSTSFESIKVNEEQQEDLYSPMNNVKEIQSKKSKKSKRKEITLPKHISNINDPYSNYNIYSKHSPQKPETKRTRLESKNPFIKEFDPKYLKKENIDKKLLRRFRAYIKETNQKNPSYLTLFESTFWSDFSNLKLLPPMRYTNKQNKVIEFKSFNTKYYLWLFSKNGAVELFNQFVKEKGDEFIEEVIESYDPKDNHISEKIRDYLVQIPKKYSKKYESTDISNCSINSTDSLTRRDSSEELKEKENTFSFDMQFDNTITPNTIPIEEEANYEPYYFNEETSFFNSEEFLFNHGDDIFNI